MDPAECRTLRGYWKANSLGSILCFKKSIAKCECANPNPNPSANPNPTRNPQSQMKRQSKSQSQSKAKSQSQSRKGNPNPPATYSHLEGDILWQYLDLKRFSEKTLLGIRELIVADSTLASRARAKAEVGSPERLYLSGTVEHVTCLCVTIDRLTTLKQ